MKNAILTLAHLAVAVAKDLAAKSGEIAGASALVDILVKHLASETSSRPYGHEFPLSRNYTSLRQVFGFRSCREVREKFDDRVGNDRAGRNSHEFLYRVSANASGPTPKT